MNHFRLAALVAIVALSPTALAACGGEDSNEDEDQITQAVETAATSGEPSVCTELQTQRFNEQNTHQKGDAALKACRRDAGNDPADSVEVSNIEVDGDHATADVAITGSFLDGSTIRVGLANESDQWKIDEISGFRDFDRASFTAAFEEEVASDEEIPPQAADCIVDKLHGFTDQEARDFVIRPDESGGEEVFTTCFDQ